MLRCASCYEADVASTCPECYEGLHKQLRRLFQPNLRKTLMDPTVFVMQNRDKRIAKKGRHAEKIARQALTDVAQAAKVEADELEDFLNN